MGYGTDGLTFRTLRDGNLKRLPMFKDAKGRTCHDKDDGSDWSPAQWLQAVVGELGEYANLRKKVERGDLTIDEARPQLADELADVVIYLDILASQLGVDLGPAVIEKWNRTSERVGAPIYLDAEDWHYKSPPPRKLVPGNRVKGRFSSKHGTVKAVYPAGVVVHFDGEPEPAPMLHAALHLLCEDGAECVH